MNNALLNEAVRPIADRTLRDPEHGLLRLAHSDPTRGHMLPGEERQDRAGLARLIAIVEAVGARIIEVDGLLDQPQSEDAGVEVEVAACGTCDRRHVVNAVATHCGGLPRATMPQ